MDLAAPLGLAVGALLVPLVLLYVLKVRRVRRRVASTWLWLEARRDLQARSPWQKLRTQLPLVVQAIALLLLALAAARPASEGRSVSAEHLAIVLDTSASMSAVDPATQVSRMELARRVAHELAAGLPPGAEAMLLTAGRAARVALPFERDVRRIDDAIDAVAAEPVEGEIEAAVALAAGRLAELGGRPWLVVVTDGALAKPMSFGDSAVPLEVIPVGGPLDNTAIVRVDVTSAVDRRTGREELQAFLMLENAGSSARELHVTMREENASDVLASRSVVIAPGERQPVVLGFHPTPGDYGRGLVFDLAPHDGMVVDDVAFGRVPEGRHLPVVVASARDKPSPWLVRALGADAAVELETRPLAELGTSALPRGALVVLEGACRATPGVDLLIVDPPAGPCLGAEVGASSDDPLITDWDHGDARLRFVGLDGVRIAHARAIAPESPRQALVASDRGALVVDASSAARHATLVGFDVGESNWPLRASFVLFVRNVLEQARVHRASGLAAAAVAGEPLQVIVPHGVSALELHAPPADPETAAASGASESESRALAAKDGLCIVPEVGRVGLYRFAWQAPAPGSLVVPVNLASGAESDLRRHTAATTSAGGGSQPDTAPARRRDWTFALALAALAFVLFDLFYFARRPRAVRLAADAAPRRPERA